MLKKILEGLFLFILVFAFTIPLLVITNTADSTDNRVHYYLYHVDVVCPDGSIFSSYREWRSTSWTDDNHPDDWLFCFDNGQGIQCDPFHTSHLVDYTFDHSITYTTTSVSAAACR